MELPLTVHLAISAVCAVVIWVAGARIARDAKLVSDHGAGQALVGSVLLGAIVSLPEMVVAIAACALGNPELAVNTLLGGIGISIVVLAVTDFAIGREPLSADITHPVVLLEGMLVILSLAIAAAGMITGDAPAIGTGACTLILFALYLVSIPLIRRYQDAEPWALADGAEAHPPPHQDAAPPARSLRGPIVRMAVYGAAIVGSGTALAYTADAIANETGLGSSFVGFVLGGFATSLPELSTAIAAVRERQYEMAFSDAFGTNLFSVMLLFVADAVYVGAPILGGAGRFSLFATVLGIALTSIYLLGIVEHRKRGAARMGWDSIAVLCLATVGIALLYAVKD